MKSNAQPPEQNERRVQQAALEHLLAGTLEEQRLLDYLIDAGFIWEEAMKLMQLREQLYENPEMRQRVAADQRMQFARWLYEQGELREE